MDFKELFDLSPLTNQITLMLIYIALPTILAALIITFVFRRIPRFIGLLILILVASIGMYAYLKFGLTNPDAWGW